MIERIQQTVRSEVKWPEIGKVDVGADVDFAYVIRKDGEFAMKPIAARVAGEYRLDFTATKSILLEEYDSFVAKLVDLFKWGFVSKGNFELHLYDPAVLDAAIRKKSLDNPIVSLDPVMHQGVHDFAVSRGYYLSGIKDFSQIARPGTKTLSEQAYAIHLAVQDEPVSLAEDDIFSGGSVIASINALQENGVIIERVIPGIQVGKPEKLAEMGMIVDPVVLYEASDGKDIFDKVDLGDPRDYLLGASGLVIKLLNGEYGRSPYILPFVSTTARASIPQEHEREFALKVLQANADFFSAIEEKIGRPILLSQMSEDFLVMMCIQFSFDKNTPMNQVVSWASNNLDKVWEVTQKQGALQEKIATLELPKNIIFIDVNGTLFSDDSEDGYIPPEDIALLKKSITDTKSRGVSVGICSDSPLPQLQKLAEQLGIDGPIAAENGNVLFYQESTFLVNSLPYIDMYKHKIRQKGTELGLLQGNDSVAKEFGGEHSENLELEWSFGADRVASVTVFGSSKMISLLGELFKDDPDISVDCSPEYNFFALHPGKNYKTSKGKTLSTLTFFGHNILMIGNSMSDWVPGDTGVQCAFVSNHRVSGEVSSQAAYVSDQLLIEGVIDILNRI